MKQAELEEKRELDGLMPLCEKCAGELYWQPVPISDYDRRDRSLWTVRAKERRTFVCGDCL